jgi:hypothetical protein
MSDVVALQRRPHSHGAEFRSPPLVLISFIFRIKKEKIEFDLLF